MNQHMVHQNKATRNPLNMAPYKPTPEPTHIVNHKRSTSPTRLHLFQVQLHVQYQYQYYDG